MKNNILHKRPLSGLLLLALVAAGCQVLPDNAMSGPASEIVYDGFNGPPRIRYGAYPAAIVGTPFLGRKLGTHGYYWHPFEKNGIVYTCKAGHVDIIHLRIAADWTAHLTARTYRHLMKNDSEFSYKLAVDRSREYLRIHYPENWNDLPKERRSEIAREIAFALGPYLTFTMTTWHEIITWYGYKCIGLPTEYPSAFSWEDSFSNLLGTIIAVRALQDPEHSYNQAVTIALDQEMRKLGIQSAKVAKRASESVKGDWYTGNFVFFVDIKKRNFDIGLDDGYVTPTLVPGVSECPDAEPVSYPVPNLDVLAKYGFKVTLEIEPREWERGKILSVVYGDKPAKRVTPEIHFARYMDTIRQEAAAKYGPEYAPAEPQRQQYTYTAN